MTDTVFVDKSAATPIVAAWLNDVNKTTYQALGTAGVAPITPANVRDNLGLTDSSGSSLLGFSQGTSYDLPGLTLQDIGRETVWSDRLAGTAPQKVQRSIDFVASPGGEVNLPSGTIALSSTGISVPVSSQVTGRNSIGTNITYSGTGYAVSLGHNVAGDVAYGSGFSDAAIRVSNTNGKAIVFNTCVGGYARNMYLEGPGGTSGSSNVAVTFDGIDASAFFNHAESIISNHWHTSYLITSTGAVHSTQQHLTNCSAFGDVNANPLNGSSGIRVTQSEGGGSVVVGGNLESCNYGFKLDSGASGISVFGTRLEGNTVDVDFGLFSIASAFFGVHNLDTVVDASGTGYGFHTFWGCYKGDGSPYPNRAYGQSQFEPNAANVVPLSIRAYPVQTADFFQYKNSSSGVVAYVASTGVSYDISDMISDDRGDVSVTLTPGTDYGRQYFATALTTNRTLTLATTGSRNGDKFRVTRSASATGASTLSVGGLKLLAVGQWCEVVFVSGTTWVLVGFGSL